MDFRAAVETALDKMFASGVVEKAIEDTLTKTVQQIVSHEMREYSDFGKSISEAVKKSLAVHGDLCLPTYNDLILKIVSRQVETCTRDAIEKQVAANLKTLLQPAPEKIKLSKLVEEYVEFVKENRDAGCVCYGDDSEATVMLSESDYGFRTIGFDDEKKTSANRCDIQVGITKEGKVYHLRFSNADVEKQMFVGPFYNFERSLFQMKAAGTVIEVDCDQADLDLSLAVT